MLGVSFTFIGCAVRYSTGNLALRGLGDDDNLVTIPSRCDSFVLSSQLYPQLHIHTHKSLISHRFSFSSRSQPHLAPDASRVTLPPHRRLPSDERYASQDAHVHTPHRHENNHAHPASFVRFFHRPQRSATRTYVISCVSVAPQSYSLAPNG